MDQLNRTVGYEQSPGWQSELLANFKKQQEQKRRKLGIVASMKYIDWLYHYVREHKVVNDDSDLYDSRGEADEANARLLSYFMDHVEQKAQDQGIQIDSDENCCFSNEYVYINIKDRCFKVSRMYGQGTVTTISSVDADTYGSYVRLEV